MILFYRSWAAGLCSCLVCKYRSQRYSQNINLAASLLLLFFACHVHVIDAQVDLAKGMPMDGVQGVNKTRVIKWCEMQVCVGWGEMNGE